MNTAEEERGADDPRLLQAARDYLAELEAGRKPDRQSYLARCPELAEELSEYFDGIELAQALRPAETPSLPEFPANPLGDFQILRELGRGGMGVVYEAVQLSLGRRVALKVLSFASALDSRRLQRFRTEAHAAAQLHHTNIVPVHAVGCERGVHFYAMQLIEGRSLAALIQEGRDGEAARHDSSAGTSTVALREGTTSRPGPRSGSTSREVFRHAARIALQVAEALEYAHEAGVIHRDIKPANLLLDARGAVWVTDFGLAQVSADSNLTQTGDLLGTLRYMSPEQAAGRRVLVDPRTDVYSLGATLYELLTLEPVFAAPDRQALLQQILQEEPYPLRRLNRAIPSELETIVLKALSKVPAERYATAGEMADDLRRFLDERPILARRPSPVERIRKWMRRHPSLVGAGLILLVVVLVGLAVATALVTREQARTQEAYQRERQRSQEAETRFLMARRAADEMIQMAEEELTDDPFQENLRKRLLDAALTYYQEFIEQRSADPDAQAELTLTRDRVKQILADLAAFQADRHVVLLKESAVLDDLSLSGEHRSRILELARSLDAQRQEAHREGHRLLPEERRQRALGMARANEAALGALLHPNQLQRLRQITLQCQGMQALRDPVVAAQLKLSPSQKEHLRFRDKDPWPGRGERPHHSAPGGRHDHSPLLEPEKIQEFLTAEQLQKWQELTGAPYKGPVPWLFPGRGGRPSRPR